MAEINKEQKRKIKKIEQEIKEEESLWEKIKAMPKEEKFFLKQLKQLLKPHKVTKKPKVSKDIKKRVNNLFWGIEPPQIPKPVKNKPKKKPKR
ncbi:hypothetical protein A3K72_03255 [Candidatus Woesearchaeota archaeon RBG_13_36_6]|nr:MAG: hypothetical protein A3K72_03255 [Candidatus Woesearchaeota archaeon RBG_13_36_6]